MLVGTGTFDAFVNPGSFDAGVNKGIFNVGGKLGSFGAGVIPGNIAPPDPSRQSNTSIGAAITAVVSSNSISGQHTIGLQPFPNSQCSTTNLCPHLVWRKT